MKKIAYQLFIWSLFLVLAGCDDDSAFQGNDNYITRFELRQGEKIYVANITGDNQIQITFPAAESTDGLTANVTVSENARIDPAPETITDWTKEMVFKVVSYNGAVREYRYTMTREEPSEAGTVYLTTQAEVDAFGAKGIPVIEGSLVLGTNANVSDDDCIVSLDALSSLERIDGNVIVNKSFKSPALSLSNLRAIGGNIVVDLLSVKTLRMPSLEYIYGSLLCSMTADPVLSLDVHTVDLPVLKEVGLDFDLNISRTSSTVTEESHLSFPSLEKVGGALKLASSIRTEKVEFPALKEAGSIQITGNMGSSTQDAIAALEFKSLEKVNGSFTMTDVAGLCEVVAPKLKTTGGAFNVSIQNGMDLAKMDFHSLSNIFGDFILSGVAIDDMTGFSSLEQISGNFNYKYSRNQSITSLNGLEKLQRVGGGQITISAPNLADIGALRSLKSDLSQMTLDVSSADVNNFEVLKQISFGTLFLALQRSDKVYDLRGFHFNTLTLMTDLNGSPTLSTHYLMDDEVSATLNFRGFITIDGLKKVKGDLNCGKRDNTMSQIRYFVFNDLEEVDGDLFYVYNSKPHEFPKLKKVSGNVTAYIAPVSVAVTPFPALVEIGGYADLQINVIDLTFPSLLKIGGELKISKGLSWSNNPIQTMDGFSSLTTADRINIQYCTELYSYQGLQKAISSLTRNSQWEVSHNAYNPSFDDVKAGKLVMPQ